MSLVYLGSTPAGFTHRPRHVTLVDATERKRSEESYVEVESREQERPENGAREVVFFGWIPGLQDS